MQILAAVVFDVRGAVSGREDGVLRTNGGEVVPQTGLDLRAGVTTAAATGCQHRRERERSGG